jgi:hypothetical protein
LNTVLADFLEEECELTSGICVGSLSGGGVAPRWGAAAKSAGILSAGASAGLASAGSRVRAVFKIIEIIV